MLSCYLSNAYAFFRCFLVSFYGRTFAGATDLEQEHSGTDIAHWGADEGTPMYYNILKQLPSMTSVRHEQTK